MGVIDEAVLGRPLGSGVELTGCSHGFGTVAQPGDVGGMAVSVENNTSSRVTDTLRYRVKRKDTGEVLATLGEISVDVPANDAIRPVESFNWPDLNVEVGTDILIDATLVDNGAQTNCGTVNHGQERLPFDADLVTIAACDARQGSDGVWEAVFTLENDNERDAEVELGFSAAGEQLSTLTLTVPAEGTTDGVAGLGKNDDLFQQVGSDGDHSLSIEFLSKQEA